MGGVDESTGSDGPTVVVVDDDSEVVELASAYVRRIGVDVTVRAETDPQRALQHVTEERPGCVVSDYEMPEMDGIEFLTTIREYHPAVPFVLFTGTDDRTVAERARERDATYLRKSGVGGYRQLRDHVAAAVADG